MVFEGLRLNSSSSMLKKISEVMVSLNWFNNKHQTDLYYNVQIYYIILG